MDYLLPIHYAAARDDVPSLLRLIKEGTDVNARSLDAGTTPLIHAAANDRTENVRVLMENGADPLRTTGDIGPEYIGECTALDFVIDMSPVRDPFPMIRLLCRYGVQYTGGFNRYSAPTPSVSFYYKIRALIVLCSQLPEHKEAFYMLKHYLL